MKIHPAFLKSRFSFVDIFLVSLVCIFVAIGCSYFVRPPTLDIFHQHSVNDPQTRQYMQQAYEEVAANRDLKISSEDQAEIARIFHELDIWPNMWWMGIRTQKNPCDMWMMQQLIFEIQPDYIIEAGTFRGGSALFFAQILDGLNLERSKVITIDISDLCQEAAKHPIWQKRTEFILGSSTDPEIIAKIQHEVRGKTVMVVLDSDHSREHVLNELKAYAPMVSDGSYIVVEDTNLDLQIIPENQGNGASAAVREFLTTELGGHFSQDFSREAMVLTFNPGGWLRKRGVAP